MGDVERRSLLRGVASALPAAAAGGWAFSPRVVGAAIAAGGSLPTLLWRVRGGWPVRPSSAPVLWVDEVGSAPRPPLREGDVLLRAQRAGVGSELLAAAQASLLSGWRLEGGASLVPGGGLLLPGAGAAAVVDALPTRVGRRITFRVTSSEGAATVIAQGFYPGGSSPAVWTTGPGTVTVSQVVYPESHVTSLWVRSEGPRTVVTSASLVEA